MLFVVRQIAMVAGASPASMRSSSTVRLKHSTAAVIRGIFLVIKDVPPTRGQNMKNAKSPWGSGTGMLPIRFSTLYHQSTGRIRVERNITYADVLASPAVAACPRARLSGTSWLRGESRAAPPAQATVPPLQAHQDAHVPGLPRWAKTKPRY